MSYGIKVGDLEPPLEAVLFKSAGGALLDLTEADTVVAHVRCMEDDPPPLISREVQVVDADAGVVRFEWQAGETDIPGLYEIEFEITWSNARSQTVPTKSNQTFRIYQAIA